MGTRHLLDRSAPRFKEMLKRARNDQWLFEEIERVEMLYSVALSRQVTDDYPGEGSGLRGTYTTFDAIEESGLRAAADDVAGQVTEVVSAVQSGKSTKSKKTAKSAARARVARPKQRTQRKHK